MVTNGNRISGYMPPEPSQSAAPAAIADLSRSGEQWMQTVQGFVAERPVICLASAFATGMVLAWFLKRTR